MIKNFLFVFIPIFVAVDAIGVLPIFINFTSGVKGNVRKRIIFQSMGVAVCLAVGFIFLGKFVFRSVGITIGDFLIAGGSILFVIAIMDVLTPGKKRRVPLDEMGIVPLGTPLIVGPAVLTATLILVEEYGPYLTVLSVVINVLLAGIIFSFAGGIIKLVGKTGTKALSKIISLFLAAFAVMMIRKGLVELFLK
ncbi:MAG: MarC family protein [Candidatus Omnitrophota bacterium]